MRQGQHQIETGEDQRVQQEQYNIKCLKRDLSRLKGWVFFLCGAQEKKVRCSTAQFPRGINY
jgi:hypothetical protein